MAVGASSKKLIAYSLGILFCYCYYGILQESITKGKYREGDKTEKFTYAISLVFLQCVINTLFAWIVLNFNREHDKTPQKYFATSSLSYVGAMLTSNYALQHVGYPTQVLGKSAKPIPVMILGILLAKKRYPAVKFLFVLMIVIGVALFMYKEKPATVAEADSTFGIGEILLLVSLTLDGLTGASQDKMRAEHKTSGYSMMARVNLWSLLWLAIGLVLFGELWTFPGFVQRYPSVLIKIVTFGIASALGHVCMLCYSRLILVVLKIINTAIQIKFQVQLQIFICKCSYVRKTYCDWIVKQTRKRKGHFDYRNVIKSI